MTFIEQLRRFRSNERCVRKKCTRRALPLLIRKIGLKGLISKQSDLNTFAITNSGQLHSIPPVDKKDQLLDKSVETLKDCEKRRHWAFEMLE